MEAEDVRLEVERAGIAAYLKDALAVLLEARPADPLLFLTAYFKHAAQPDDLASLVWYLIRPCPRSQPCFRDNLYSAFSALARRAGREAGGAAGEGVATPDLQRLLRLLCRALPPEVSGGLLAEVPLQEGRLVQFPDFVTAVEACLAAEEALHATTDLFDACDRAGRGTVPRDQLLAEIDAQRRSEQREQRQLRLQQQGADGGAEAAGTGAGAPSPPPRLPAPRICPGDMPPVDVLRAQLAEFEAEDGITAGDLFVAFWRLWRAEEQLGEEGRAPGASSLHERNNQ